MKNKVIILGYILVLSMFLGCANMLAIPRVKLSYWNKLKPINVIIRQKNTCYSSKIVFTKGGYTLFKNVNELQKCEINNGITVNISQKEYEKSLQWNLIYLAERIKDCR